MELRESYIPYGTSRPICLWIVVVVLGCPFLSLALMSMAGKSAPTLLTVFFISYVVGILIGKKIDRCKDAAYTADKYSVTFSQIYKKSETIYFSDIDTVTVYNQRKRTKGSYRSGGGRSFYVETLVILTLDGEEHIYKMEMDLKPNARMEAMGIMDKMFEMGKFSVLKKHIEANEVL